MTDKQERFVQEYLIDLNATQAAIRAGYGPDSAEVTGSRLLRNVKVQEAIQQAKKLLGERAQIKADQVFYLQVRDRTNTHCFARNCSGIASLYG